MSETALIQYAPQLDPGEQIKIAKKQADALMEVVKMTGIAKKIGDKQFLQVEAWQTIARFNGYLIDIAWTKPMMENGVKVGYEARAELVRIDDGTRLSGAEAECRFDETVTTQEGEIERWGDDFAVRSMSQTRAQSKVGRAAFAWVAVLAGYAPTPAEEMTGAAGKNAATDKFPFGDYKGKTPTELPLKQLKYDLPFWEEKASDPKNKYAAKNARLVEAIKAAIAEKEKAEPSQDNGQQKKPEPPKVEDRLINASEQAKLDKVLCFRYDGLGGAESIEAGSQLLRAGNWKAPSEIPLRYFELLLAKCAIRYDFAKCQDGSLTKLSDVQIANHLVHDRKLLAAREAQEQAQLQDEIEVTSAGMTPEKDKPIHF